MENNANQILSESYSISPAASTQDFLNLLVSKQIEALSKSNNNNNSNKNNVISN